MKHLVKQTELSNTSIFSFVRDGFLQNIKVTGYPPESHGYL